ncbi:cell cycle control protein [Metarhizium brunneum]
MAPAGNAGNAGFESTREDGVFEIHLNPTDRNQNDLENLLHPPRSFQPFSPVHRARLRAGWRNDSRPPQTPQTSPMAQPSQPQRRQSTAIIDLTEEPDSPAGQRHSQTRSHIGRNLRRTNSQRITAPSLSRSDSTFMGPGASVIDLTMDSPEDERAAEPRITRSRPHHHHRPRSPAPPQLVELTAGSSFYSDIARGVRRMTDLLDTNFMTRGFNVTPVGFPPNFAPQEPSPEPSVEPIPLTRDGFTRDTSSTEERIVVCPACNDELAYDPMEAPPLPGATSANGRKRKRAPGEHHFWALKKCGHVYCADCFENRKPTEASPHVVGFRGPQGKTPNSAPNGIRCAVENCQTKAALKTEWVGIYL